MATDNGPGNLTQDLIISVSNINEPPVITSNGAR